MFQYSSNLSPGQYPLGTFLDELGSKEKKKHGEFSKCDQHPEKPCERVFAFTLRQYPRRPVSGSPRVSTFKFVMTHTPCFNSTSKLKPDLFIIIMKRMAVVHHH